MNDGIYVPGNLGSAYGRAWRKSLSYYSDLPNRLERGRKLFLTGRVLSFELVSLPEGGGAVYADVRGSKAQPYKVTVKASQLAPEIMRKLTFSGETKEDGSELPASFAKKTPGLFPLKSEISFDCTCQDWAHFCKHSAAVMYRFADMLDSSPACILKFRGAEDALMTEDKLREYAEKLLAAADGEAENSLSAEESEKLFGPTEV